MFCDGKCKPKDNKRCGLLATITMKNEMSGDLKQEDHCVLWAIMASLHRQEQGQVRLQAAVESDRNEMAKGFMDVSDTLAKGAIGLIKVAQQRLVEENRGNHAGQAQDHPGKLVS